MQSSFFPQEQVFWFLKQPQTSQRISRSFNVDVVIIGGGLTGITAAQAFRAKGCSVIVLEQYFCGAGASGKSSGFITPNSELDLAHFKIVYGMEKARALWEFVSSGVAHVEKTIKHYNLECDYSVEDTVVVANNSCGVRALKKEYKTRSSFGYDTIEYTKEQVPNLIGSDNYYSAIQYSDTFGINPYQYLQNMKHILIDLGVHIFEESPVISIEHNNVTTAQGFSVKAEHIVLCTDYAVPQLGHLKNQIYHVQTCAMVSEPLSEKKIRSIFPQKNRMAWDTDFIYQYYRIIDGNRFLIGGGTVLSSYAKNSSCHPKGVYKKLSHYMQQKFPHVPMNFEYIWPGLIGISKDIVPIAGRDKNIPSLYYAAAVTGLPWAAAIGNYSAENIIEKRTDFDAIFSPYRTYPLGGLLQTVVGTKATFSISNLITLKLPRLLRFLTR